MTLASDKIKIVGNMTTITISKKLLKEDKLVVLEKRDFERITKENVELRAALGAILAGEAALRSGRTKPFRSFLKSRS